MIKSEAELNEIIDEIIRGIPDTSIVLFRGQTEKFDELRSGKARRNTLNIPEVENGWNTIVNRISTKSGNNFKYNHAVLQHYGFPTYYLDLTSNPIIAAWFASNTFTQLRPTTWIGNSLRLQDKVTYKPEVEGLGYIYVLEIPNYKGLIKDNYLFNISEEEIFIRPKNQDAYLLLDQPPRIPNPNSFVSKILEIDREKFLSSKTLKEVFPHPNIDKGYSQLLSEPFIQCPPFYLNEEMREENKETLKFSSNDYVFAKRAINIPFYIDDDNDLFDFKPKRNDLTIFEPSPFRLWKNITFNLSEIHSGINCRLGDATKITISPKGLFNLMNFKDEVKLEWAKVNSNNIFFVKGEYDHDIGSDHQPPYSGIWLHRNDDLIFETSVNSNENGALEITPGHAYLFRGNKLTPVDIENECSCGNPNQHLKIIEAFFRIHGQTERQKTALIQHPFAVENWMVLL
ncbi:FRG domain-containing protein [Algoriphagus ratkowskyi]|uniref:FRG domain-containing protein n=1 Tax=Algoriphagus ratkowskyi TaxID=57028 RepID=A0A2W7RVX2_9BACT|nr:FRG domain-containing protein [Algoriphagus ratkowskyi]PZX59357.1 FRG domain-containing protein [Algoriphagus ratkowskyi]TXD77377.1 FRG domain-containing protein [Algoriphagus ratkowskyi]